MTVPAKRCELARRLRTRHELDRTRSYWRAPVRLCRGKAVALVSYRGQPRDLATCEECFNRELLEHPADVLSFEVILDGRRLPKISRDTITEPRQPRSRKSAVDRLSPRAAAARRARSR